MKSLRQQNDAENELIEALSAVRWKDTSPDQAKECPSTDELSLFVKGRVETEDRRERLVAHLSTCDLCLGFLQRRRQRRSLVNEAGLIFAAASVLVFAIVWGFRTPTQVPTKIATVDLRPLFPTRGGEAATTAGLPSISPRASWLRLILPAGTEGNYECEILSARKDVILMHVSGETSLQDHQVVLDLPMGSSSFKAGHYFLALRKQDDGWMYYPLTFD